MDSNRRRNWRSTSIAEIHEREIESLGPKIAAVSENGRATDDRLSTLINVVERQLSEGRN